MLRAVSLRLFYMAALLLVSPLGFAQVSVEDAWIREVPPGSPAAAVFMVITNASDKAVRVTKMVSPVAKRVEWHDMKHDNGLMRMTQRKVIKLPANGRVQLQPSASHVMLFGMERAPAPGSQVPVILSLDNGQQLTIHAVVRKTELLKKELLKPKHHHH